MKNTFSQKALISMLMASIALSPFFAFAKEKNENSEAKEHSKAKVTASANVEHPKKFDNSCLKAIGHLIALGWIKHNGAVNISIECNLPFGIAKKHNATSTASTTPDTTAPVIRNITTAVSSSTLSVGWITNEKATSKLFYGTTSPLNTSASSTLSVENSSLSTSHSLFVSGLSTSTHYFLIMESKDSVGNNATTGEISVTTLGL